MMVVSLGTGVWALPPGTYKAPTLRDIPSWCGSIPLSDWLPACQPYSKAELEKDAYDSLSKIRKVNPELAKQSYKKTQETWDAYCRLHPEGCGQLKAYWENPMWSRIVGPGTVVKIGEGVDAAKEAAESPIGKIILIGGVALLAAVAMTGLRRQ